MPQNYTIDDSQWSTSALALSPGWNMLRTNGSNQYINSTQVDEMQSLLSNFWNNSISWTSTAGSETTLTFVGTDIWAFGISGPLQGQFNITLDNATIGTYTAQAEDTDYHHLLFTAHNLDDGPVHQLTLTCIDGWLSFDYAVIESTANFETASTATATSTTVDPAAIASAASSTAAQALYTQYSAAQLASLEAVYKFKWNGAAYFVVIFAALVLASFSLFGLHRVFSSAVDRKRLRMVGRKRLSPATTGESWLMSPNPSNGSSTKKNRERPRTRVLEALKGKNISHPIPSDGASWSTRRDSEGTRTPYDRSEEGHEPDEEHGW